MQRPFLRQCEGPLDFLGDESDREERRSGAALAPRKQGRKEEVTGHRAGRGVTKTGLGVRKPEPAMS